MPIAPIRVHAIVGGFPPGQHAGHDMDFARVQLLTALQSNPAVHATISNDFADCAKWMRDCQFLITYVAGPYADDQQASAIRAWLEGGGRWLALHGSSGGKAVRVDGQRARRWVRTSYHEVLGSVFLTHPPICEFTVDVRDRQHALTQGLPASFRIRDEPYMIEVIHPDARVLLTTSEIEAPAYVTAIYGSDGSLLADGRNRALGYVRDVGKGGVAYFAFGHCHSPATNVQVTVARNIDPDHVVPLTFRGAWENASFLRLLGNGITWGTSPVV